MFHVLPVVGQPLCVLFLGFRQKWAFRLLAFTCLCEAYHHWALEHRGQQAITAAIEISYYVKLCTAFSGIGFRLIRPSICCKLEFYFLLYVAVTI